MEGVDLADLRREYRLHSLDESDVAPDPFQQFAVWFREAVDSQIPEPNAMTVATAMPDGAPAARIVLMKGFSEGGWTFFTNYRSRKGSELEANPRAALVFYWKELERQVRIAGRVERLTVRENDEYFHSRPRPARIAAYASRQSEVLGGRAALEERMSALDQEFEGREVPLPEWWGGYVLDPLSVEFWQGRPNRLHDRVRYVRDGGRWRIERLNP